MVGRDFTAENVQKMIQLRDAANMIVMDTLLNQQDRMGNIHALERYYYLDPNDVNAAGQPTLRSAKIGDLSADDVQRLKAVEVSEMILKDNDCGVSKQNIDKQAGLDNKIAHIDPSTYERLLRLNAAADLRGQERFSRTSCCTPRRITPTCAPISRSSPTNFTKPVWRAISRSTSICKPTFPTNPWFRRAASSLGDQIGLPRAGHEHRAWSAELASPRLAATCFRTSSNGRWFPSR